ncbi:hypothetical protein DR116_0009005 [Bacillus cereus]|uniref:Uncharacterized protein n=1 Tax=Bacillus cereus TaxID=1396 RepID=A0A9X8J0H9_BACCE|nr:hypothetical protein DR116_0009005 [Bacillus cereus]
MRKVLRHEELAAEARYIKKHPITGRFFIIMHLRLGTHPGILLNISTIFLIYQRFDTTYRFTDNLRQGQTTYIPPIPKTPFK